MTELANLSVAKKINKYFLLILIVGTNLSSFAQKPDFFRELFKWDANLKAKRLGPGRYADKLSLSSACFIRGNEVVGIDVDIPLRIASISKVYTTYWAMKKLGESHQFKTQAYYKNKSLYIETNDPLFNREHIFRFMRKLNDKGVKKLENVYFNRQTPWLSRSGSGGWAKSRYLNLGKPLLLKTSKKLFNTNYKSFAPYYRSFVSWLESDDIELTAPKLVMSVKNIEYVENNPFDDEAQFKFKILSKSLSDYFKLINTYSLNNLADHFFESLGGRVTFHKFIYNELNTDEDSLTFYTGSGYDLDHNTGRQDNFSTCRLTLKVFQKLEDLLVGVKVQDLLAYAGRKEGTLKERFIEKNLLASAVSAKTGTLGFMPTSALAGVIGTREGSSFFAILNQYVSRSSTKHAKSFQELILTKIGTYLGARVLEDVKKEELLLVEEIIEESPSEASALTNMLSMLN